VPLFLFFAHDGPHLTPKHVEGADRHLLPSRAA
jgi:hypothetical protein